MRLRVTVLSVWNTITENEYDLEDMKKTDSFPTLRVWAGSPYASQIGDKATFETKNGITEAVVVKR